MLYVMILRCSAARRMVPRHYGLVEPHGCPTCAARRHRASGSEVRACVWDEAGGLSTRHTGRARARRDCARPIEAPEKTLGCPRWCCIACGLIITDREHSRLVAGRHVHRCTNPAGLTFEIGCFREASGCVAVGEPSLKWTWFPGCRWQVALCRQCSLHLGWRYTGEDAFFGLILDRLVECGEKVS